ncbi:MAG: prolipoprotein diacylglyceryl transferase [Clostridia bacterium]|nr:prolipoprotein diacylglyceryl transferase [Clostridia bacterium]
MTTYNVTLFGLHFKINPVAFTLPIGKNGWDIYWYGIIIATGFLLAVLYAAKFAKRFNLNFDRILDVVLVTAPVSVLCARTYYVLFDGEKLTGISDFFGIGTKSGFSGLAIYGGVIGAAVCATVMCKIKKINVFDALDIASIGFLIGQGVGRWGNFTNQEAFGALTGSSFWGMQSERTVAELGEGLVHPCFLYESIWCIAGFFILNSLSKKRKFSGQIALYYCVWYGFGRAIIELLRTDSLMIGPLKVSCVLSLLICISAAVILIVLTKKINEKAKGLTYQNVFASDDETTEEIEDENE